MKKLQLQIKMDEYKKHIKINAIKAAREKADYLLLAIGEKPGKAISVSEPTGFVSVDDGTYDNRERNYYSNSSYGIVQSRTSGVFSGSDISGERAGENTIGDKTIKLNYSINAEFAIQ